MNERIKQLAADAGYPDYMTYGQDKVLERFAELIVRECIKKCQDHPSIIFKNERDADVVSTDIVHRLESHFGVEE